MSSFVILTCELSWVMGMLAVSIANFVVCFQDHIESTMIHILPNFAQNLMLIQCSKNHSLIFVTRHRHLISAIPSTRLALNVLKS